MAFASMKTEAIVLVSSPFREVDRVYRMLTKEYGKVSVRGRGALKPMAKLASHLELPGVVQVEYVRGRQTTTVIAVDVKKPFIRVRNDVERQLAVRAMLTLVDRYTDEEEHDTELYALTKAGVAFVNDEESLTTVQLLTHLAGFLVKFMDHLGYRLQLGQCLECRGEIVPLAFRWHAGKGGLVCSGCSTRFAEEWFASRVVSDGVVRILRRMQTEPFSAIARTEISRGEVGALAHIVHDFMMTHLPGRERAPFWEGLLIRLEKPATSG